MALLDEQVLGLGFTYRNLIIFIVEIALTAVIARLLYMMVQQRLRRSMSLNMSRQAASVVQYVVLLIGLYIGLMAILRYDFSALLISLGFLGIAVAFAAQQIIGNFLAAIIISVTRQVQVDDWVEVGGVPTTGLSKVQEIRLMNTILSDKDGRTIYVANALILTNKLVNYSREEFNVIEIGLWVASLDKLERIEEIVYEEADRHPLILPGYEATERRAPRRLLRVPGLRSLLVERADSRKLDPTVDVVDIQAGKARLLIRLWTGMISRREAIITEFLTALKARFDSEGITLANA